MEVIVTYAVVMLAGTWCGYKHAFVLLPFLFVALILGIMAVFANQAGEQ